MGLFNFLKYNKIERAIINFQSQTISRRGIPSAEAKRITENMFDQIIEESKKEGTYYLPQNLGDIILGDAGSDDPKVKKIAESIRQKLPQKKKEGVKDEDVRWWWNQPDILRRYEVARDEVSGMFFLADLEIIYESSNEKAATNANEMVRKYRPVYDTIYGGEPDDTNHTTGDDKPLPCELKRRIMDYNTKSLRDDNYEKNENDIEQSSSFNALIRKEIRAGNL